jgi:hypothetical protein
MDMKSAFNKYIKRGIVWNRENLQIIVQMKN